MHLFLTFHPSPSLRAGLTPLRRWVTVFGLLLAMAPAQAQLRDADPDWEELQAPPPPVYDLGRQVSFEILHASNELKWGIDPKTITVSSDGVTRYVVMATSRSGSTNVFFEAINCLRGEVKTYARVNQAGQWTLMEPAQWKGLNSGLPSRHALALARTAFCEGAVARTDVDDMVRRLKTGPGAVRSR